MGAGTSAGSGQGVADEGSDAADVAAIPPQAFLDGKVVLHGGDSRALVKALAADCLDAVVTDPPYALVSIVKRFGKAGAAAAKGNDAYVRASAGFMGKAWDTGEVAFDPAFWVDVLAAMKPGAHLVAFSGTRSYHRLACAIEDAGFEIRDQLAWVYGSGFPKSHDVAKAIDKKLGGAREKKRVAPRPETSGTMAGSSDTRPWIERSRVLGYHEVDGDEPATAAAAAWQGWGTALKPAWEPIVLARKPLVGTVAGNVLQHGTGALNIDACRIGLADGEVLEMIRPPASSEIDPAAPQTNRGGSPFHYRNDVGRWPANIVHDGSDEVVAGFPDDVAAARKAAVKDDPASSPSRFFYTAKADGDDRLGSRHPTVKPVDLMQWLVRLVCPKGGTVLDPFSGTGTTGEAAWREGCRAILFEREADYRADIARRMDLAMAPARMRKSAAARRKASLAEDDGGLFGQIPAGEQGGGASGLRAVREG